MKYTIVTAVMVLTSVLVAIAAETKEEIFVPVQEDVEDSRLLPEETVSIHVTNAPLMQLVDFFITNQHVGVACNATVTQHRVTASVTNAHWQQALELILKQFDLSLIESPAGSRLYSIEPNPAKRAPVHLPFEVVVEAQPTTYYEIYVNPFHNMRPEMVASGRIGKDGTSDHALSAVDAWSVTIIVKAKGHADWKKEVRLLGDGEAGQTFRAVLEEQKQQLPEPNKALDATTL